MHEEKAHVKRLVAFFVTCDLKDCMGLFQTKLLQKMAEMEQLQIGLAEETALSRSHLSRIANGRVPLGARAAGKIIAALGSEAAAAELLAAYLFDEIAKVQTAVDESPTKKNRRLDLNSLVKIVPGRARTTTRRPEAQPDPLRSVDQSLWKDFEGTLAHIRAHPEKRPLLKNFLRALADAGKE